MDNGPLVIEEIDAGKDLIERFHQINPVKAAFWLKAADENQRYLYIASDDINDTGTREAYRRLSQLMRNMDSKDLDPFRVKLIGGNDPLAQEAMDIQQRFPLALATRFGGRMFGGMYVDDGYIYSLSSLTPTT